MSLRDLRDKFKYDEEYIHCGLMLDLSYYLKQLMLEKGLNKKQLAERMGVSPAYITKIFSGQNISLKTVAKILSALEVDAGIKIIDREKEEYKVAPNKELLKLVKKGKEDESKAFSIAA
ncbi:helix-turn-helix transcriptional regulator [Persephonella sp. KM09-Lau-8]|uniref:helix-turn-helix domain-containing protein n=1 Tax=Persephonella sp. KM09-Lau-8 TaxID=1158345 RepID=UPI00049597BD|nr:helix-turn-helix transcriptional regulator [Persephonella sp. KM09-Lau-8]